jgi:hypothetical protein
VGLELWVKGRTQKEKNSHVNLSVVWHSILFFSNFSNDGIQNFPMHLQA